jgi:dTDP-4-dehydrorhamnose 3,5-epimerase
LYELVPQVYQDTRGWFTEIFKHSTFKDLQLEHEFTQDNLSFSKKGVVRGLHLQLGEYTQTKLVRVMSGRVLDVVVDLRKNSPTYKKTFGIELSEDNMLMMLVPKGFAHGFITLSEVAVFHYKCDEIYLPNQDGGIRYNDSQFNIDWKIDPSEFIVSDKDRELPEWSEIEKFVNF